MTTNFRLKSFFLGGSPIPRWVVLSVDLFLIYSTFIFTFFLVEQFQFSEITRGSFLIYTTVFCLISFITNYSMALHVGLLRYSNSRDFLKMFQAVFISSSFFLLISNYIIPLFSDIHFNHLFVFIFINFFISTTTLILFRAYAKLLFNSLLKKYENQTKKKVLIYGSDKTALLVKRALEGSNELLFQVEGFIDENTGRVNTSMEQKRIYPFTKLSYLFHKKRIDELIIINENLSEKSKIKVIDTCLSLGLPISLVPPAQKWLSGKADTTQIRKLKVEDLLLREPITIDQENVNLDLRNKRILITGAAGSIGFELTNQILQYNPSLVILCDQAESPLHELQLYIEERFPKISVELIISDVRCYEKMYKLFNQFLPEIIYHAAAYKHVPLMEKNPLEAVSCNILGTKILADLSVEFNADKFVLISTDKAVNPTNIMGASKRIAEIYIHSLNGKKNNTKFITTRFGNVLGSNGSVIPRFKKQILNGGPITVTHPDITRYFMTVAEAVQLVLQASAMGKGGEILVFDMGTPVKIVELAKNMIRLAGLVEGEDIKICFTGLRPGEKLYEELLADSEYTVPTFHSKIKIAKVRVYDYLEVESKISNLLFNSNSQNCMWIVKQMKEIVPEYISNNSPFEELDQKNIHIMV